MSRVARAGLSEAMASPSAAPEVAAATEGGGAVRGSDGVIRALTGERAVSYTHLRAHETSAHL
eukprot:9079352-Alexandrium_andersonii.AAC.1